MAHQVVVLKGLLLYISVPSEEKYKILIDITSLDESARIALREEIMQLISEMDEKYTQRGTRGRGIKISYRTINVEEPERVTQQGTVLTTRKSKKKIVYIEMIPIPSSLITSVGTIRTEVYAVVNRLALTISEISHGGRKVRKTFLLPLAALTAFNTEIERFNERIKRFNGMLQRYTEQDTYIPQLAELLKRYDVQMLDTTSIREMSVNEVADMIRGMMKPLKDIDVRLIPVAFDRETLMNMVDYTARVISQTHTHTHAHTAGADIEELKNRLVMLVEELTESTKTEIAMNVLDGMEEKLKELVLMLVSRKDRNRVRMTAEALLNSARELNMPPTIIRAYELCYYCAFKYDNEYGACLYLSQTTGVNIDIADPPEEKAEKAERIVSELLEKEQEEEE